MEYLKQIKELMAAMGRTGTKRLRIKHNDFELDLEREDQGAGRYVEGNSELPEGHFKQFQQAYRADEALSRGAEMPAGRPTSPIAPEAPSPQPNVPSQYITSPMVGTFYTSPSPEDPPYVKVGDKVDKQQVVCIIEAMKVLNEIKAGMTGTIAEILLETGHPVEFGTKLFRIVE